MLILLADANTEVLAALKLVLEQKQEYKIVGEVNDTIGLFSQITHHCPDVIILDADLHGLKYVQKRFTQSNGRIDSDVAYALPIDLYHCTQQPSQ